MSTLFLNAPAGHATRAFVTQKTARPDQTPLLVDNHHLAEAETLHQQATGTTQKNSEQNARYLLAIPTSGTQRASSKRRFSKK